MAAQSGRRDARAALVGGLRYDFNDGVSFSMLAGYDKRTSTLDSRNGERFTAGVSLDFDVDFARPRGFAAR